MSIQSSLNQAISVFGHLFQTNPAVRDYVSKKREAKEQEAALKSLETKKQTMTTAKELVSADAGASQEYQDKIAKISQQQFEAQPTPESAQEYLSQRALSTAGIKAAEQLKAKQEEKRKSRRFIDYMRNEPTSLGATIGELQPDLQKRILSTYSKNERQKIMNRKDRERNVKK